MTNRALNRHHPNPPMPERKAGGGAPLPMSNPTAFRTNGISILSVSANSMDGPALERSLSESGWSPSMNAESRLITRRTLAAAFFVLQQKQIAIVVCNDDLISGTWRDMLECISMLPDPPLLVVTSRLADERLWAEALNLGAYDVLVQPFDAAEVFRILSMAWQHWQDRHGVHRSRTRQRMASTRG